MKRDTAERERERKKDMTAVYTSHVWEFVERHCWHGQEALLAWPKGNPRNAKLQKVRKFNVMAIRLQGFCMHAMYKLFSTIAWPSSAHCHVP